jgi:hypothetical protein
MEPISQLIAIIAVLALLKAPQSIVASARQNNPLKPLQGGCHPEIAYPSCPDLIRASTVNRASD